MRAMALASFGPPDVLQLTEIEAPQAGPGEVRVRIKAAGVLPFDCGVRSGSHPLVQKLGFPIVPGNEFAGIIDQIGDGVKDFSVGNEVLGFTVLQCYAEFVVVSADQIVIKPKNMPWEIAGGFSGNGQGAHLALKALGVGQGDTVLIHAAAGGLGTFSIQLAKVWGAKTVIGTANEANHDYLRSLGAIPVSYGEELVDRVRKVAPEGVDAALDAAGPDALRASVELVKDKDRIRTMVSFELANELGIPALSGNRSAAKLAELVELYSQGKIHIHIRDAFPLQQAAAAHQKIESGHGRGKIVLTID
ncbi:NADP-dependent oxidoreductase [Paenibacillus sp. JCM 10914]|uniref:NADP-dependent oxidoreductase n=1 Tax=Paenibacillus sp. JCM 10914 TaxID=1236974 RepID=UPI00055C39FD|nr:NADP-dependent oxidoreductase [Paenibacillus sp. JCM 10914]